MISQKLEILLDLLIAGGFVTIRTTKDRGNRDTSLEILQKRHFAPDDLEMFREFESCGKLNHLNLLENGSTSWQYRAVWKKKKKPGVSRPQAPEGMGTDPSCDLLVW